MAGGAGGGGGPGSGRRRSRRDSLDASPPAGGPSSSPRTPPGSKDRRTSRRLAGKPVKERWLLTRKTWRYMADAGRRLIPDSISGGGGSARPEDSIPKIERYFQDVCAKEPRFLLWRKASYPGSLAGFRTARRRRGGKIGGSCRAAKTCCSADEADDSRGSASSGSAGAAGLFGKQDRARIRSEWLGLSSPPRPPDEDDARTLADMLDRYLSMQVPEPAGGGSTSSAGSATNSKQTSAAPSTRSISVSDRSAAASVTGGFAKEPNTNAKSTSFTSSAPSSSLDYQKLIEKLEQHLNQIMADGRRDEATRMMPSDRLPRVDVSSPSGGCVGAMPRTTLPYQSDLVHKQLLDTLGRYYSKSPNRQHVISDILTDRKLLEKLYFDLRCTRGFRGPRATGAYAQPTARYWTQPSAGSSTDRTRKTLGSPPPPLIAVQGPSTERGPVDSGTQTDPVPKDALEIARAQYLEKEKEEQSSPPPSSQQQHKPGRRRSSLEEDVSPSVSDTIKRYLRMARKKSVDSDKADRFKRVNYDRNLRNIKAKGETTKPGDDEGNSKGCQTVGKWMMGYREMRSLEPGETMTSLSDDPETSRNASSRSSIDAGLGSEEAPTPKQQQQQHQSFLSHFLHHPHKDKPHSAPGSPALTSSSSSNLPGGSVMQKSKSSSSVVSHGSRLVAKKIWKSRSKSSSRSINLVSAWTPQGKCTWAGTGGRRVTLQETPLRSLSEVERKVLCRVAVAKLQALNLGVHIRLPTESLGTGGSVSAKPKRRAYLLKRKALTTGFFDSKSKDDKDKESSGGFVFGISLQQCLENDRLSRIASGEIADVGSYLSRSSRHGSRTSFTSLIETTTTTTTASKTDEGGSCESLSSKGGGALTGSDSGVLELSDGGGPPGEWDAVPSIVKHCIMHLESTGLHTLGIFRVSPSKKRVRQLREDWDFGRESKIGAEQCPHDVAALLKEYFRDLPDPLLCRDLYQAFVHTQKLRNRRLQGEALKHMIQLLPMPNRETLHALLNFLAEVAANSEDRTGDDGELVPGNKMDVSNLATVFAPNILHCVKPGQSREVSAERAEERIDVINVVRALLENVSTLFTINADTLDELYLHMMDSHPAELDLALSRRADEQCPDEADLCSETENYSVEENVSPTSTSFPKKLYSREECLHQSAGTGGDPGPRVRRSKRPAARRKDDQSSGRSNSVDSGSSEDPQDPARVKAASPMVITASLTIPMTGAFTLNLDDPDIPYIEDAAGQQQRKAPQSQHYHQPNAPPRRQRQRSVSGSEGGGGRHGSDSAVGSSATLSGDQPPSSPPSWASSPPASPDSAVTAVSYIPEPQQPAPQQQVLQRVSFTTSSELRQITRSTSQQEAARATIAPPHTPSITSIGGAVMRSKTADIERMIQSSRNSESSSSRAQASSRSTGTSGSSLLDSKKYTKRRYTDSRHQTRHIPDAESLGSHHTSSSSSLVSRLGAALHSVGSTTTSTSSLTTPGSTGTASQPVWKRRELISSAPKQRGTFF